MCSEKQTPKGNYPCKKIFSDIALRESQEGRPEEPSDNDTGLTLVKEKRKKEDNGLDYRAVIRDFTKANGSH